MTRLPAKFLMKPHQRKREERDGNGDADEEKDTSPSCKLLSIPVDIETEIMTRLPAKSLIKFRCVSKMWSSIIRSPKFIDSHYAMSSAKGSRFAIVFSNNPFAKAKDKRLFIFTSSYEEEKSSSLVTNLDMVIPSMPLPAGFYCASIQGFIGCCGLCLVCNPSTKTFTTIPGVGPFTWLAYDPVEAQIKAVTLVSCPYVYKESLVHEFVTIGGGESSWRRNKFVTPYYYTATSKICIGGFLYHGAWSPIRPQDPVIVCFDVRHEKISFIKVPMAVVCWESDSILIDYKGKLASIARYPCSYFLTFSFHKFDLWILEDADKHEWSKQTFELPYALGMCKDMTSPGTNKAGEIIFAPKYLPRDVQPFYIFYYNVERKDMRRVRLLGIADDQDFRRVNEIANKCRVFILPEHVETIASL